ncbi:MAG TPA: hypothetical protein VI318_16545 [Baekduia sp.]
MPECFVIMPLTTPKNAVERYGGDVSHFLHVLEHLFVPAIEAAGFAPKKPIAEGSDMILAEIVRNLQSADMVLCDVSTLNANVFLELGIRTALNHPICVVRDEHTSPPFDVGGINFHEYAPDLRPWVLPGEVDKLAAHIKTTAERSGGENALWKHFGLTQSGTDAINAAPDGAPLKLILDELRRLRHDEHDGSDPDNEAFLDFDGDVRALFPGIGRLRYKGRRVVGKTGLLTTSEWARVARLAEQHGLSLEFEDD